MKSLESKLSNDPRIREHWVSLSFEDLMDELEKTSKSKVSRSSPKTSPPVIIISHADDEGVRINKGRPGAKEGPSAILHFLGRCIVHPHKTPRLFLLEEGRQSFSLAERHQQAETQSFEILKRGARVITLGGGHDYGYPDASAYFRTTKGKILNVDAHLDSRPVIDGQLNSGTPFFRFIKTYGGKSLIEWGIQDHCNADSHRAFVKASGARIYSWNEACPHIAGSLGLSICLDAFRGIRGVSAPALVGLDPNTGLELILKYRSRSSWLGLYEAAPSIDEDAARLAAIYAHAFIHL